ncbi:MAG: family 1 glycosylhydrolase [Methylomonas sp.]|jgi:beta-glucosidase/6-phospho-beta-glucosidase/beta-galactosidase
MRSRRRGDFLWGVATSAYQSEGGYNQTGMPHTNWAEAERRGDVEPLGRAAEFWSRYRLDFDACRRLGLNAFRLSVEWSRVQPAMSDGAGQAPAFDYQALDCYGEILCQCRAHGLEPLVTLHHFVHPAWLGADAWLSASAIDRYVDYVRTAALYLNRTLAAKGYAPVRYYITINEPNMLVLNTYIGRQFPSQARRGRRNAVKAIDHLLTAHARAYNAIHATYRDAGWPAPMVTVNTYCSDLYWCDKLLLDLLSLRERRIEPAEINDHIRGRAAAFEAELANAAIPLRKDFASLIGAGIRYLSHRLGMRWFDIGQLPCLLAALTDSPGERLLDYIAIDYYDPFSAHTFRPPVWWDHEFKNKSLRAWIMSSITSKWWDWTILPRGLHFFCRYYADEFPGRPLIIAENGMALRRRRDNSYSHRRDNISRSEFLRLHIEEVIRIVGDGIPLIGYLHWSLFDNYEWGTYTPRFGLYSLNYQTDAARLERDHHGDTPAETYALLIREAKRRMEAGLV